ncbi:MAG: CapA family protein [Candidatus Symbiothrix sp.]|jgi:poly-gamma-glutamate capsule biosynthesis protein CapA/YwtB (metallophosphatase superfamily)|nr:CapA family protein [Candidatus Symbiothrix sp.]
MFARIKLTVLLAVLLPAFSLQCYAQKQAAENEWVSIIGAGDIMLGSNYPSDAKLPPHDGKELLSHVKDILRDADVTFGNLEGCILDKGGNVKACKSGCYFFRMPDRYVNYLVDAGFDVMNIANNHNGDFGAPGRENTVKVLKAAGLHYAGLKDICETSRFEINGVKYGFCGFAPNTGTVKITDLEYAKKLVKELDKDCDIVIVSFHGGAEGKTYNHVTRKSESFYGENRGNVYEFAHAVIDAGADVVFGHGPHVVRAAELYKDRFIIYSMGNFCTSGDFSISGISGYAPIVKVFTDKNGKFVKGKITSALQKDKNGPVLDPENLAAKEIKRLTESDFPETTLSISNDGTIQRKELSKTETLPEGFIDPKSIPTSSLPFWLQPQASNTSSGLIAQDIIDFSQQFLGKPYHRGGKGPNSFDCSGFTSFIFKNFGYKLSPGCVTQVNQGTKINKEELQTGDLIFFKGRNAKSARVGHVGIVISNKGQGDITFIHASHRGIIIEDLQSSAYYKPRYVTGLRVL